jgi:hypothetical protein
MIGTQGTLGVGPPGSALLFVIASPVGPYYPTGFKAISLEATDYAVRAWPGGVGDKKLGANYAMYRPPTSGGIKRLSTELVAFRRGGIRYGSWNDEPLHGNGE